MVQNDLTEEEVIEKGDSLSFPGSVVEYFQGYLGIPPFGFPEPLRSKVCGVVFRFLLFFSSICHYYVFRGATFFLSCVQICIYNGKIRKLQYEIMKTANEFSIQVFTNFQLDCCLGIGGVLGLEW